MDSYIIKEENTLGIRARRIIAHVVLIFMTLLCLFWFYVLFINATRTNSEIMLGFSFLPGDMLVKNFKNLLADDSIPIVSGLINSLIVSGGSALLATYFSTMTAFAIHAYNFKFKNAIFTFILMVMMIPTQVTTLGFIKMLRDLDWTNQLWPLIIPSIASPTVFFYLKQYMQSCLPHSLLEAARIDGSGEFRTFNTIVMPLMKPAIAVQAIFTFVSSWNNYFTPALILTDLEKKTLPILLAMLRSKDWSTLDRGQVYMMISLSILPVIVVYMFLSKHIVQGLTVGSVKE
ncbi:MAG: carbohydrate ABC transporter permease [Lachnospiraceae bacterium]|nr:carbohydrate ABC transporter permease [Lachnospiraceae bacterium]